MHLVAFDAFARSEWGVAGALASSNRVRFEIVGYTTHGRVARATSFFIHGQDARDTGLGYSVEKERVSTYWVGGARA